MKPGLNYWALLIAVFAIGYKIGNSTNDELKKTIDKFINFANEHGEKIKGLIGEFLASTEDMSSDEIKANIEKIMSTAVKKMDKIK